MLLSVFGRLAPLYCCNAVPESLLLQAANLRHHKLSLFPQMCENVKLFSHLLASFRERGESIRVGAGEHEPRFTGRSR